jgi:hypothetical protein
MHFVIYTIYVIYTIQYRTSICRIYHCVFQKEKKSRNLSEVNKYKKVNIKRTGI